MRNNKLYQAIADALHNTRPCQMFSEAKKCQWNMDVMEIAKALGSINVKFKREYFLNECGGLCDGGNHDH